MTQYMIGALFYRSHFKYFVLGGFFFRLKPKINYSIAGALARALITARGSRIDLIHSTASISFNVFFIIFLCRFVCFDALQMLCSI